MRCAIRASAAALLSAAGSLPAADWQAELTAGTRAFVQSSVDSLPDQWDGYLAGEVAGYKDWGRERQRLEFRAAARWDSDDPARHLLDIREAYYRYRWRGGEWAIGIDRVFWGVTEALHLVDIINQTDLAANPDTEDKLGQPMLRLTLTPTWGQFDFFVLPAFRERSFPGPRGRLRGPIRVVEAAARYESSARRDHIDVAARYSHYIGPVEFAVGHFSGTTRQPLLEPLTPLPALPPGSALPAVPERIDLAPVYFQTDQTSLEATLVTGRWLWKLEAITAREPNRRFQAATGGFEVTFNGVAGNADLGVIAEYQYDERANGIAFGAQDDVVVGARLAFNDFAGTEALVLVSRDLEFDSSLVSVEASRRFSDHWRGSIEARFFSASDPADALTLFAREDYWQIALTRFF
ncbi:MAG: hypothetical protein AAGF46_07650 [Pseudomonadota bacterium]